MGAAISLLINFFIFFIGLLFGFCAKRPNHKNDGCCVKPTANRILSMYVIIFLLKIFDTFEFVLSDNFRATRSANLAVFTTAFLCVGFLFISAPIRDFVCDPLRNPLDRPDVLKFGDRVLKNSLADILPASIDSPSLKSVLEGCATDKTFYEFLKLVEVEKTYFGGKEMDKYVDQEAKKLEEEIKKKINEFFEGENDPSKLLLLWNDFVTKLNADTTQVPTDKFASLMSEIDAKLLQLQTFENDLVNGPANQSAPSSQGNQTSQPSSPGQQASPS